MYAIEFLFVIAVVSAYLVFAYYKDKRAQSTKMVGITDTKGARANISDLEVFGNSDTFVLICKASSKSQGWLKSTKAMEIPDVGCVVQVTTQQGDNVAEALTFVPGVTIKVNCVTGARELRRITHPTLNKPINNSGSVECKPL